MDQQLINSKITTGKHPNNPNYQTLLNQKSFFCILELNDHVQPTSSSKHNF